MPQLLAVNVGLPRDVEWRGETVHTAVWKQPVTGRRMARRLNLDGDGQGDLGGHGGEQRAVMVYQMDSYRYWQQFLGRSDFEYGQFGENFTVEGLSDDEVCVGDRYRIGSALFEVTQPRVTCYRVGMRMKEPRMASLLVSHHRPGFYLRVLEEGEVAAGDEIFKVTEGPERLTVADTDALLYLPGHSREQLERALRVPALSAGWKDSFRALLEQDASGKTGAAGGNAGLTGSAAPRPAWRGFRKLRVAQVVRESANVSSFWFEAPDGAPLPAALPGQFLVLKLQPADGPKILRNYSLSSKPGDARYRVSVKQEAHGAGSTFLGSDVRVGDEVEVSAPRGNFTVREGPGPVVLLSAGIGATPVLAMLYALSTTAAARPVWWLYGARNGAEHPFAAEALELLQTMKNSRRYVAYSRPGPDDRPGAEYDAAGHLSVGALETLGVPKEAEFYLCGPASFLKELTAALVAWGVEPSRIYSEAFGAEAAFRPGVVSSGAEHPAHAPVGEAGTGPRISFTRSGLSVPWSARFQSLLELAEACDVPVKWSCRTGVCHTCECALIDGSVKYEVEPLEPPIEGNVLICCSIPASDLEIDL